ncbi:MAG: SHOCT domain-containing protein [Chitinophagaceae bacterium]
MYDGYHFGGMHLIWWIIWIGFIIWIFATPWDIPGQMKSKDSALDILQKRFASGAITKEQYHDQRAILKNDISINQSE